MREQLYTPEEAADLLNVPVSTLRRKAGEGLLPHRRVFKHIRFSAQDLEEIQEIRRPRPRSANG